MSTECFPSWATHSSSLVLTVYKLELIIILILRIVSEDPWFQKAPYLKSHIMRSHVIELRCNNISYVPLRQQGTYPGVSQAHPKRKVASCHVKLFINRFVKSSSKFRITLQTLRIYQQTPVGLTDFLACVKV